MTKQQQQVFQVLVALLAGKPETKSVSWGEIRDAVSAKVKVKNWLTEVRGPLQGGINSGVLKRTDSVKEERYFDPRVVEVIVKPGTVVFSTKYLEETSLTVSTELGKHLVSHGSAFYPGERPGFRDTEAQTAYAVHGFELTTTGGNCTAFQKLLSAERHILVTIPHDAEAPTKAEEAVHVGLYGNEHSEELDGFDAANVEEVAAGIAARNWK